MRIEPEIASVSIVLVGNFNPAIFTPAWFVLQGLLPEKTIDTVETNIVHAHVTQFNTDWLSLNVTSDQFQIETLQAPVVRLRDLAIRVFKEQLPHTPLTALGINRHVHFPVHNIDERNRLGRLLAPVGPWGDWGKTLEPDGSLGGMTSLTMTQVNPVGRPVGGMINVKVEPSNLIGQGRIGVYVGVNDHFAVETVDSPATTEEIVNMIEMNFDHSLHWADQIIDHIMSLTRTPNG